MRSKAEQNRAKQSRAEQLSDSTLYLILFCSLTLFSFAALAVAFLGLLPARPACAAQKYRAALPRDFFLDLMERQLLGH